MLCTCGLIDSLPTHLYALLAPCRDGDVLLAKIHAGKPAATHSLSFNSGEIVMGVRAGPVAPQGCQHIAVLTQNDVEATRQLSIIETTTGRRIMTSLSICDADQQALDALMKGLCTEAEELSISLEGHLDGIAGRAHSGCFTPQHKLLEFKWLPGGHAIWLLALCKAHSFSMQVLASNDGRTLYSRDIPARAETLMETPADLDPAIGVIY